MGRGRVRSWGTLVVRARWVCALGLWSLVSSCGPGVDMSGGGTCPQDTPASCPAGTPPSYASDVAPVIAGRCSTCHAPNEQEPSKLFGTYSQVFSQRTSILGQIHACKMPPAGAPTLTSDERRAVLTWLVCGAPDN